MFIGHHYHALEQKGRLAIPAGFRKELGKTGILTRGLDGCLFLFPKTTWEKTVTEAQNKPFTQKSAREWVRLLTHNAVEVDFDSQGRILIPEFLRAYGNLKEGVVIAGSLNRIEIWQKERYHQYMISLEAQAEAIAERVGTVSKEP